MSNFFEQELWRLFGDGKIIGFPTCAGRVCFGTLGKDLRARIEFISTHVSGEYDALKLTVLNRTDGTVDSQLLRLKDLLGKKPVPGNPNFRRGVSPYIWDDGGKFEWYAYQPTDADYKAIQQAAGKYLGIFRERQERTQDGPKLVYICAPLRGDVERNIEIARQKAQEVFQAGDIPICPHLMYPPVADLKNPTQDQAARDMGLRLVESCQEVKVCTSAITEGMWAEINHAGLVNLLFPFEGVKLEMGGLAMWRLQTHSRFGGTWLSDYVHNRLDGFTQESFPQKPKMELQGQDGNIFGIMGRASRLLKQAGQHDQAEEMISRVTACGSYDEAFNIISEYVETELSPPSTPQKSTKMKARNAHER